MTKFAERYVLGEGYPWSGGKYRAVYLFLAVNRAGKVIALDFPDELYAKSIPKYRLVLERVYDDRPRTP